MINMDYFFFLFYILFHIIKNIIAVLFFELVGIASKHEKTFG